MLHDETVLCPTAERETKYSKLKSKVFINSQVDEKLPKRVAHSHPKDGEMKELNLKPYKI